MNEELSLQELVRHMLAWSGTSAADVSRSMDKSNGYLTVMLYNETTPRVDLLIRIAEACGYALVLQESQGYESWELTVDNGSVRALKEHGPEDIEQLSQMDREMREHFRGEGRKELIDSLIEYLEGLKEKHSD